MARMSEHGVPRRRGRAWVFWVAFVLLLAGGIAWRQWEIEQHLTARREAERRLTDNAAKVEQRDQQMGLLYGKPLPEVREALADMKLVAMEDAVALDTFEWVDAQTGFKYRLVFARGRLRFITSEAPAAPEPTPRWWAIESVRQYAAGFGLAPWVALLGLVFVLSGARRGLANAMLGLVVLVGAAWALGRFGPLRPHPSLWPASAEGVEGPMLWVWLVVMGPVSAGVMAWAYWPVRDPNQPLCPQCNYDLTGNESGVCPMCGRRIPPSVRWLISQRRITPVVQGEAGAAEE